MTSCKYCLVAIASVANALRMDPEGWTRRRHAGSNEPRSGDHRLFGGARPLRPPPADLRRSLKTLPRQAR